MLVISIHEAAKASTVSTARLKGGQNFNPRSRKGFDAAFLYGFAYDILFQSTKPQRLRRWSPRLLHTLHSISIHEAAKASTGAAYQKKGSEEISIHEAAKASTKKSVVVKLEEEFQSTKPQRLRHQNTQ